MLEIACVAISYVIAKKQASYIFVRGLFFLQPSVALESETRRNSSEYRIKYDVF